MDKQKKEPLVTVRASLSSQGIGKNSYSEKVPVSLATDPNYRIDFMERVRRGGGQERRLISKLNAEYYLGGKKIKVESKATRYYHIFDILISCSEQERRVSYAKIEKCLLERSSEIKGGYQKELPKEKRDKNIRSALSNFFRYSNIENKMPDNTSVPIIDTEYGYGFIVHNPPVM